MQFNDFTITLLKPTLNWLSLFFMSSKKNEKEKETQ